MAVQYTPQGVAYQNNPDFRGYLSAQGGQYADLLNYVGGADGNNAYTLNTDKLGSQTNASQLNQMIKDAYSNYSMGTNINQGVNYQAPSSGGGGNASGLSGTAQSQMLQALGTSYDVPIQNYQTQLGNIPSQYNTDVANTLGLYGSQQTANADQTQNQLNIYGQQEANTTAQQQLSLAQLAENIRSQNTGYQNQLAERGAGSSSAAGMAQYALGKQQAQESAGINLQANTNNALIQQQMNAATTSGQDYSKILNQQQQGALTGLLNNYKNQMYSLQNSLAQSQGGEARDAIYYTKQALDNDMLSKLNNLNSNIGNAGTAFSQAQNTAQSNISSQVTPNIATKPDAVMTPQIGSFSPNLNNNPVL